MSAKVLQIASFSYPDNAKSSVLSPAEGKQLKIYSATLINRTAGAIDLGILRNLSPTSYALFKLLSGVCTDVTSLVQAGASTNLVSLTNNDGFVVESAETFNLIGLDISQAETGTPVYAFQYWNGSAWTALPTISVPTAFSAGTALMLFATPLDWAVGGSGLTGASAGKYHVKVIATTAPTQIIKADSVWVGHLIDFAAQVPSNAAAVFSMGIAHSKLDPIQFEAKDTLMPYFGGTKTSANMIQVQYLIE